MEEATNPVGSVSRAFEVVDVLVEQGPSTVSAVADELDLAISTTHSHLATLVQAGYVVREGERYRASLQFLDAGAQVRKSLPIFRVGAPEVDSLAESTGELTNLSVDERYRCVHIYQSSGSDAVTLDTHAGAATPMHATASGKAILAHRSDEYVDSLIETHGLPALTDSTVTTRSALETELDSVRDHGYAVDDGERLPGLRCVAAPVTTQDDTVLGAVSVSGPARRVEDDRLYETLPGVVMEAADVIGITISYGPDA